MPKRISTMLAATAFFLANAAGVLAQSVTEIKGAATARPMARQQPSQQYGQEPRQRQRMKRKMLMPGGEAKENIQKVTSEIRWHSNLNSALAQAHRQNKMVLWVHMIGNLSGAT